MPCPQHAANVCDQRRNPFKSRLLIQRVNPGNDTRISRTFDQIKHTAPSPVDFHPTVPSLPHPVTRQVTDLEVGFSRRHANQDDHSWLIQPIPVLLGVRPMITMKRVLPVMIFPPAIVFALFLWSSSESSRGIQVSDIVLGLIVAAFILALELATLSAVKRKLLAKRSQKMGSPPSR